MDVFKGVSGPSGTGPGHCRPRSLGRSSPEIRRPDPTSATPLLNKDPLEALAPDYFLKRAPAARVVLCGGLHLDR